MSAVPPHDLAKIAPSSAPPNHLIWAITSTIIATCLCCPFGLAGIVAIVFSSKVDTLLSQGDSDGARRASDTAKVWCWVTTSVVIVGVVYNIIMLATVGPDALQDVMNLYTYPFR